MPNLRGIKNTIYDWVKSQSLVDDDAILWQYQNFQLPNKPVFSLRIMSMTQIGDADFVPATSGNPDERDMVTTLNFVLEILGFGTDIVEKTVALKNSLNVPSVHQALSDGRVISWNNTQAVLDISGIDGNENEERSSYDAFMRTTEVISNIPVGQISKVNAVGTLKQPGKPDYTRTINVDAT